MMFMINSLLLDSSILVEYAKNNKTELLDYLLDQTDTELYINSIVLSEYTYHWLANNGKKSPRSLQQSKQIGLLLAEAELGVPLSAYTVLPVDDRIVPIYLDLMQRYNLLPNDALIIATAKLHGIPAIASFDADFMPACQGESIQLIREITDIA
jgi:predicted nucleic acid-binding protein